MSAPEDTETRPKDGRFERRLNLCIVSLYGYGLFNQSVRYRFGGAEVRGSLFGKALALMPGFQVSFVVFDHGQDEVEEYGNIEVHRHSLYRNRGSFYERLNDDLTGYIKKRDRLPYIELQEFKPSLIVKLPVFGSVYLARELSRRLRSIGRPRASTNGKSDVSAEKVRVYREVDADIYCVFGVTNVAGEVASFCKETGKKFVLFIASDSNLDDVYAEDEHSHNVYGDDKRLCEYAIRGADLVFVQTEKQGRLLLDRYGKRGTIVGNPIDLKHGIARDVDLKARRYALWVGRSDPFYKRPMMLIELARRTPEIEFVMVMNPHNSLVEREVRRSKPPNVTIIKHVPYDQSDELFARSFALVNTSVMEGFPNTFLQAGKYSVPILSLQVDPDGFIERHECGIVCKGNFDELVKGLRLLRDDLDNSQRFSENIRRYVEMNHSLDKNVRTVERSLQALYASSLANES